MLKFQSICACVALGVVSVLTIPMDMDTVTTIRPEATTEDTSGRLLSLPNPEKCANSKSWILIHSILIFTKSKHLKTDLLFPLYCWIVSHIKKKSWFQAQCLKKRKTIGFVTYNLFLSINTIFIWRLSAIEIKLLLLVSQKQIIRVKTFLSFIRTTYILVVSKIRLYIIFGFIDELTPLILIWSWI